MKYWKTAGNFAKKTMVEKRKRNHIKPMKGLLFLDVTKKNYIHD